MATTTDADAVWLTVPPYATYLRTVRLVAADAAARAGLARAELEDFRIAVDELCQLLMSSTDNALSVSFGVRGNCVIARGFATRRQGTPLAELPDVSRIIVNSLADFFETHADDLVVSFSVAKRHWAMARQS